MPVAGQIGAVFLFIGLRRLKRAAKDIAHPLGKPAFKANIDRQNRKDGHKDCWDQSQQDKHACQPQVKSGTGGLCIPRRHHACDPPRHEGRDNQHIDKVSQKYDPQRRLRPALIQRPQHDISQGCQDRAQGNKAKSGGILNAPLTPPAGKLCKTSAGQGPMHYTTALLMEDGSLCRVAALTAAAPRPARDAESASGRSRFCCGFTSTFGAESRGYPDL